MIRFRTIALALALAAAPAAASPLLGEGSLAPSAQRSLAA